MPHWKYDQIQVPKAVAYKNWTFSRRTAPKQWNRSITKSCGDAKLELFPGARPPDTTFTSWYDLTLALVGYIMISMSQSPFPLPSAPQLLHPWFSQTKGLGPEPRWTGHIPTWKNPGETMRKWGFHREFYSFTIKNGDLLRFTVQNSDLLQFHHDKFMLWHGLTCLFMPWRFRRENHPWL